jgi:hypothetical protein
MATYATIFPPQFSQPANPPNEGGEPKATCYGNYYEVKYQGKKQKKFWEAARLKDEKKTWFSDKSKKREKKTVDCKVGPNTLLLCIFPYCIFLLYCTDPQVEVQIRILLKDKYRKSGNPTLIS